MKRKVSSGKKLQRTKKLEGNEEYVISTGSTLLDLAISGGRVKGGGLLGGIFVEIFGPSSAGKTVLLSEIAGAVKRGGGEVMFKDPEARLDAQFAKLFDLDVDEIDYDNPDTVPEVFKPVRSWEPKNLDIVNGIFSDSLAALSTDQELDEKDQYGMRRGKEFSEELRKTCRVIKKKNYIMVASNQVRENVGAVMGQEKYRAPGGLAIGYYASLRLRLRLIQKIQQEESFAGKKIKQVIGVRTEVEVYKSSVWKPYMKAPLTILFEYGIDDIRENLQFIKDYSKNTIYCVDPFGKYKLSKSKEEAISIVEEKGLEGKLKNQVISLWMKIQEKFTQNRKKKVR